MSRYQEVKEVNGFLKDTLSGAIINTDVRELKAYKKRKHAATVMRNEIDEVKQDVSEIKDMLKHLINIQNNQ